MPKSLQQPLPQMEVNRVDRPSEHAERVVNKVDRAALDVPLAMAKVRFGSVVGRAIGPRPLKEFGDKGLLSNVVAGPKVPDYLARIYQDRSARRRMALALLEDDSGVVLTVNASIPLDDDERKAG